MSVKVTVTVNSKIYLRDPLQTQLGKKILEHSVLLIEDIGFESFNFKKLAEKMSSTEASVYRYFENKHKLLIYLTAWYWDYMHYCVQLNTRNITEDSEKLKLALKTIANGGDPEFMVEFIDHEKLHQIIIDESSKAYHTKFVDEENKIGLFANFKRLSGLISEMISGINPEFPYPHALATTFLNMTINHVYYADHLPSLTEVTVQEKRESVEKMMLYFAETLLRGKA